MVGPAEADIDFDIIKNDNDTFTVKYMPPGSGQYTIMVLFADQVGVRSCTVSFLISCFLSTNMLRLMFKQQIPISPFRIKVEPSHDAAKVRAEGPGLNKTGDSLRCASVPKTGLYTRFCTFVPGGSVQHSSGL